MKNNKELLQPIIFFWAFLPLINLAYLIFTDNLGVNPHEFIQRYLGTCALVLLLLTYSIPLIAYPISPQLMKSRRMFGLFTFTYMSCHFLSYLAFEHAFVLRDFINDFFTRPFVLFGTFAIFITVPLALTSNNRSMKVLGKWWKKLHSTINFIIVLSLAHYFLHKSGKNDFLWPIVASIFFLLLYAIKKLRNVRVAKKTAS